MTQVDLLARYDQRVPRYTSYPTAPHFSPAVDAATYAGWLAAVPEQASVSLYLHVPFCEQLCLFCGCHTTVARHNAPRESYAALLETEIGLVAAALGRRQRVAQIHWGGGTPTALPADSLRAVFAALRAHFDLAPEAEIAVEIDPRNLPPDRVQALADMGITRASLGVQDFDPAVQHAVQRLQSFAMTRDAAEALRRVGVRSLNLDLLYGLPHQTAASVAATMHQALELAPDRVAVFGYAHVPWMKPHQRLLSEADLPDGPARFAQRQAAEAVLVEAGFRRIGLDHYARAGDALAEAEAAGRVRRNFQGYTVDDAELLIGLGASAIGALAQGYVQNAARTPVYAEALRAGALPVARGVALSAEDRLRRSVIEALMCELAADLPALARAHGAEPSGLLSAAPLLADLAEDGLIRWDGRRVELTETGRPFVRNVAAVFDTYLATGQEAGVRRHARSI